MRSQSEGEDTLLAAPFHSYSSHNQLGGRTHPRVARLRNRALDMWAEMADYATIAECLDISLGTVASYIRRAKRLKDPRAKRPWKDKKIMQGAFRRRAIKQMHAKGLKPQEIARQLGCTRRLVELRIKELGDASR